MASSSGTSSSGLIASSQYLAISAEIDGFVRSIVIECPGKQLANAGKEGVFRMVLHTLLQILQNDTLIGNTWHAGISKNLLNLRSEDNLGILDEIVETALHQSDLANKRACVVCDPRSQRPTCH